jgi:hypothetical protein
MENCIMGFIQWLLAVRERIGRSSERRAWRRPSRRLGYEQLEARRMMAALMYTGPFAGRGLPAFKWVSFVRSEGMPVLQAP